MPSQSLLELLRQLVANTNPAASAFSPAASFAFLLAVVLCHRLIDFDCFSNFTDASAAQLTEASYVEGSNIILIARSAEGVPDLDRVQFLVLDHEVVALADLVASRTEACRQGTGGKAR
jgi:hypothetical protein